MICMKERICGEDGLGVFQEIPDSVVQALVQLVRVALTVLSITKTGTMIAMLILAKPEIALAEPEYCWTFRDSRFRGFVRRLGQEPLCSSQTQTHFDNKHRSQVGGACG